MNVAAVAIFVVPLLAAAVALSLVRLVRGPSLADRIVAFDVMSSTGVGIVAAVALATGRSAFVDVALLVALVGFLATAAFARFIERGS